MAPIVRIEYHSEPDTQGRRHYTVYWLSDYHPGDPRGEYRVAERGQVFFAKPNCSCGSGKCETREGRR